MPPFDCLTCDCYVPSGRSNMDRGVCHGRPPRSQFIGYQEQPQPPGGLVLGGQKIPPQPMFISTYAQVGKGDWCAVHPMFDVMRWARKQQKGSLPAAEAAAPVSQVGPVEEVDDEIPLPGEVKPGAVKETPS